VAHAHRQMLVHVTDRDIKEVLTCLGDNDDICFATDNMLTKQDHTHLRGLQKWYYNIYFCLFTRFTADLLQATRQVV
jgi:hypothetical protein